MDSLHFKNNFLRPLAFEEFQWFISSVHGSSSLNLWSLDHLSEVGLG